MELPLAQAILRGEIHSIRLGAPIDQTTCNIDYPCGDDILLHISLRPSEQVAIINDRFGGIWGEEIRTPIASEVLCHLKEICIRFEDRIQVDFGEIRAEFARGNDIAQADRIVCYQPFSFERWCDREQKLTPPRLPIQAGDCHILTLPGASQQCYLNYTSRDNILLHISFRPQEGVLVINDQRDGQWRDEVRIPLPPAAQPIQITFEPSGVRISVGNEAITLSRELDLTSVDAISGDGAIQVTARPAGSALDTPSARSLRIRAYPPTIRNLKLPGAFLDAKQVADIDPHRFVDTDSEASFATAPKSSWVRLLVELDFSRPANSDYRIRIRMNRPLTCANPAVTGLGYFDPAGIFRVLHRFPKGFFETRSALHTELKLSKRLLTRLVESLSEHDGLLFYIEFEDEVDASFAPLEVEPISAETAPVPYRESLQPLCERLASLNQTLWSDGNKCPASWLLKELHLALRFECFETASEILKPLASSTLLDNPDFKREYLLAYTEVALAEGRIDDLRALLLRELAVAEKDDALWTALSLCFPPSFSLLKEFGTLPSGKPNRFLLSKVNSLESAIDLTRQLLRTPSPGNSDLLLLASLYRNLDTNLYRDYWNRFLAEFQLSEIASIDTKAPNVLGSTEFSQPAPQDRSESVSVIMSAFNAEATLDYAVRSILNQTHRHLELLICDDCSSDQTAAKLAEWRRDPRVKTFRSQANQGPYNIRNALVAKAKGDYLTFQDADDLAHPQRIERQLIALRQSDAEAVFGRWIRVRPDGEIVFFRDHNCVRMCVVSLLARRNLFIELGGYRQVLCAGDTELLERLRLWRGPESVYELNEPLIFGLWSDRSLTQQIGLETTEAGYRAPARRRYAELAARQRLLGREIVPDDVVNAAIKEAGIFRAFADVIEL